MIVHALKNDSRVGGWGPSPVAGRELRRADYFFKLCKLILGWAAGDRRREPGGSSDAQIIFFRPWKKNAAGDRRRELDARATLFGARAKAFGAQIFH